MPVQTRCGLLNSPHIAKQTVKPTSYTRWWYSGGLVLVNYSLDYKVRSVVYTAKVYSFNYPERVCTRVYWVRHSPHYRKWTKPSSKEVRGQLDSILRATNRSSRRSFLLSGPPQVSKGCNCLSLLACIPSSSLDPPPYRYVCIRGRGEFGCQSIFILNQASEYNAWHTGFYYTSCRLGLLKF